MYVNELSNHRVSIFDTNGCFLHCFGKQSGEKGELNGPFELQCNGCMYISAINICPVVECTLILLESLN